MGGQLEMRAGTGAGGRQGRPLTPLAFATTWSLPPRRGGHPARGKGPVAAQRTKGKRPSAAHGRGCGRRGGTFSKLRSADGHADVRRASPSCPSLRSPALGAHPITCMHATPPSRTTHPSPGILHISPSDPGHGVRVSGRRPEVRSSPEAREPEASVLRGWSSRHHGWRAPPEAFFFQKCPLATMQTLAKPGQNLAPATTQNRPFFVTMQCLKM